MNLDGCRPIKDIAASDCGHSFEPLNHIKKPQQSSKRHYKSLNDHDLPSGSAQLPQTRGCSIQDPSCQEDQQSLESAAARKYSTQDGNQDHDQTGSVLTLNSVSQSLEGSLDTMAKRASCLSVDSEDCKAEDHPILMTEPFSSAMKTESACDHEANDQPQADTKTVISESPSLYLLIQEPLNILEKIQNVQHSIFVSRILDDKSDYKVKKIIADHPKCQHCQIEEIFRDWIQGHGMTPVTWNTLVYTLRYARLHTLANDICSHVSRDALFLLAEPHGDPETYSEAAKTLRNRYIDPNMEFAYTGYTSSIPFLDVSLKNMTSGVPIPNSVFIQNLDKYSRVSIAGQAGAGKTTLLWYIAKGWANHRVLQSTCDVLFLVQLERLPKSKSYTSLEELFEGLGYQKLNIKELAGEIDTRRESKACFLIDDFASTYSAGNTNFIHDLVYDLLPLSHVIFTSKPYVTKKSDSIEYVEVLGYKDEDLEKHLNTLCKDEEVRKSMLTLWEEQPTMREMCLLPLHLAMVIDLVKYDTKSTKDSEMKLHGNELKIQTRTDIYLSSMNQKLEHFEYFSIKQCILEKQSDPLCKKLNKLLKVAFDMVFTGQNTFDYDPDVQNSLANIGLVTITKLDTKMVVGRTQVLYIFTHPTYREFLAAIYMATLPLDEQLAYITMYGKDVAFSNVWLFYFGLPYEYGNETDIPVLLKRYSAHYSHQLPAAGICDFEFESRFLAVVREIYRADRNPWHKGFITLLKKAGIVVNFSLCLQHSSSYEIKDEKFFERLFLQVNKSQFSLDLNGTMDIISFTLEDKSHAYCLDKGYHQLVTCVRYKEECEGIQGITRIQGNPRSVIDIIGATAYVDRLTPAGIYAKGNSLHDFT